MHLSEISSSEKAAFDIGFSPPCPSQVSIGQINRLSIQPTKHQWSRILWIFYKYQPSQVYPPVDFWLIL